MAGRHASRQQCKPRLACSSFEIGSRLDHGPVPHKLCSKPIGKVNHNVGFSSGALAQAVVHMVRRDVEARGHGQDQQGRRVCAT